MRYSLLLLFQINLLAQTGTLSGIISDASINEPLPFANISWQGTTLGAVSDIEGKFTIEDIPVGTYNVMTSYIDFQQTIKSEIMIGNTKTVVLNHE